MRAGVQLGIAAAGAAVAAWVVWARTHPSPLPYGQRFALVPVPPLTVGRVRDAVAPRPGERLLEVGPGTGRHAVAIAEALGPDGSLAVVDVQEAMLAHLLNRASEHGLENVAATPGDARDLPFADGRFDGAYVVQTLGEVGDQDAALAELARVLAPGGRLVVGESPLDPHFVPLGALRRRAEAAGLVFDGRVGSPVLGYLARFEKPAE